RRRSESELARVVGELARRRARRMRGVMLVLGRRCRRGGDRGRGGGRRRNRLHRQRQHPAHRPVEADRPLLEAGSRIGSGAGFPSTSTVSPSGASLTAIEIGGGAAGATGGGAAATGGAAGAAAGARSFMTPATAPASTSAPIPIGTSRLRRTGWGTLSAACSESVVLAIAEAGPGGGARPLGQVVSLSPAPPCISRSEPTTSAMVAGRWAGDLASRRRVHCSTTGGASAPTAANAGGG